VNTRKIVVHKALEVSCIINAPNLLQMFVPAVEKSRCEFNSIPARAIVAETI